ncbi:MAG: hypothetical protein HOP91_00530 [Sphingomonas sp.]|nr:hypothetical protein [Sphingomonas sp.]
MLSTFINAWDVDSIFVFAPIPVVLLCGGEMTEIGAMPPRSLRDAFYKIIEKPYLKGAELIRAEDTPFHRIQAAHYADLLRFEMELAQLCDVILLFCESIGSVSEFSSFIMDEEINRKLLVVMRHDHYYDASFLREGPTKRLTSIDPEAVYLIDDTDIGITRNSVENIDISKLGERLRAPIKRALERGREHRTLDTKRPGHVIKLATGLVQEFGALTLPELCELLGAAHIEVTSDDLAGYMLCGVAAGWIEERRKGSRDFYFAKSMKSAVSLKFKPESHLGDGIRRRYELREHWKENDPDRHRGIIENEGA